jgi:hypothetical protein
MRLAAVRESAIEDNGTAAYLAISQPLKSTFARSKGTRHSIAHEVTYGVANGGSRIHLRPQFGQDTRPF